MRRDVTHEYYRSNGEDIASCHWPGCRNEMLKTAKGVNCINIIFSMELMEEVK